MFFADTLGPTFPVLAGAQLYRYVLDKLGKKDKVSLDDLRKAVKEHLAITGDQLRVDAAIGYLLSGGRLERIDAKTYRVVKG